MRPGGEDLLPPMKTKQMCVGCRDNFYNGNNQYGVMECWHFPTASVEDRIIVGVNQRPPYDITATKKCLSCYKPSGSVAVKPQALTNEGYWRS